jgi:GxxExxY protein
MHPLFEKANALTEKIVGAAIEVHRDKGPGLIESIYEWCLACELQLRGIATLGQKTVTVHYKGFTRDDPLRFDLLVEDCVLVETKAVEHILSIHKAQLMSYMKLLDVPLGPGDQLPRTETHRRPLPPSAPRRQQVIQTT